MTLKNTETDEIGRFVCGELPCAVLENGKFIMKSSKFRKLEKSLGKGAGESFAKGQTVFSEGEVYFSSLAEADGKTLLIVSRKPFYDYIADVTDRLDCFSMYIRSVISDIENAFLLLSDRKKQAVLKNHTDMKNALAEIELGIIEIFSEISVIEEFSRMRGTAPYFLPHDISVLASVCAENTVDSLKEINTSVKVSASGEEGIFAVLRPESVRMICAAAVREALIGEKRVNSISFRAEKEDGKAVFEMEILSDSEKTSEFEEYFPSEPMRGAMNKVTALLADELCGICGAEKISEISEGRTCLKLVFPPVRKSDFPDNYGILSAKSEWKRSPDKFSPENSNLRPLIKKGTF